MKKIDYLSLDGHALRTFLAVLEEQSVSRAAKRLGVTQSAVSHTLTKLRLAVGDPLFVKSGRGISATAFASSLHEPIRHILDDLKSLTDNRVFDPTMGTMEFTVAANDYQRDLIFPALLRRFRNDGINARFHFIPSGIPANALLGNACCDMIITPFPPEGDDIIAVRLFDMQLVCFYDATVRTPPKTLEEFCSAPYIVTRFADNSTSLNALSSVDLTQLQPPQVSVPNFADLEGFMIGTDLITAVADLFAQQCMKQLAMAPLPFPVDRTIMYLVWHRRDRTDPAHQWLREEIKTVSEKFVREPS